MKVLVIVAGCIAFGVLMATREYASGWRGRAGLAAAAFVILAGAFSVAQSIARDRGAK